LVEVVADVFRLVGQQWVREVVGCLPLGGFLGRLRKDRDDEGVEGFELSVSFGD
jgi:hypothetical protein